MLRARLVLFLAAFAPFAPAQGPTPEFLEAYQAGIKAMDANQFETAITSFQLAGAIDPTQKAVWGRLGAATLELAKTKSTIAERQTIALQAADAFARALAIGPQDANVRTYYGVALGEAGKLAAAREAFATAIKLDPANAAVALLDEAVFLHRAGMDREAYDTLGKVPESNPRIATARRQQSVAAVGIYLQSARQQFQDLRGKQTSSSEGMRKWESNLGMQGGTCSVGEVAGTLPTTSLQCDFEQTATLEEARLSYERLIEIVREGLGPSAAVGFSRLLCPAPYARVGLRA